MSGKKEAEEKYTFFWKIDSPFSQFHPATFTVDGVKYSCTEQYMMHQKAKLFQDDKMAAAIMGETVPKKMKAFGRKVQRFDAAVWNQKCRDIVKKGNLAKFSQNPELKKKLLDTDGTVLVEASPRDRIWGIGLSAKNPAAKLKKNWRGKNWLGYTLTEVRKQIMSQESHNSTQSSDTEHVSHKNELELVE